MPTTAKKRESLSVVEQLTQSGMERCVNFTGLQHDKCKAGVVYESVRVGASIPCITKHNQEGAICSESRFLSEEEARASAILGEARLNETGEAMERCRKDANGRRGIVGRVECPRCQKTLHYSVAGYNGHIWGQCETQGCVSWMQ